MNVIERLGFDSDATVAVVHAADGRGVVRAAGVLEHHGGRPDLGFPARFDGQRPRSGRRVPELGQDTSRLVTEAGFTDDDLPRLQRRAGVGRRFSLRRWLARWLVR